MKEPGSKEPSILWHFKMAWRDARTNKGRLILFMASIVLGITAIVSLNGFREDLVRAIDEEAQELLGADLQIEGYSAFEKEQVGFLDSFDIEKAHERSFLSMVSMNGDRKGSRLVLIKAFEKGYPFYGRLETSPRKASDTYLEKGSALVSEDLMVQFGMEVGDSIQVGKERFRIEGELKKLPGQSGLSSMIASPVVIPLSSVEKTGLIQKGSRIRYRIHYLFNDHRNYVENRKAITDSLEKNDVDHETVKESKEDMGEEFNELTGFLNLVGFVALLLGCIGVASSIHIYMKEKVKPVAVLRCIGASRRSVMNIFLIQVLIVGAMGSLTGAVLGSFLQTYIPTVMKDFLPFTLETELSLMSIAFGLGTGVLLSSLFALAPLIRTGKTSPLMALNDLPQATKGMRRPEQWRIGGIIVVFILLFGWYQTNSLIKGAIFTGSLGVILAGLTLIGNMLMKGLKRFFPSSWSFVWRQGISNLFRPNNQTLVLILAVGLGTALISTMFLTRDMLLQQTRMSGQGNEPNTVLFDIQPEQIDSLKSFVKKQGMPIIQEVPIVAMRIRTLRGRSRVDLKEDTTQHIHDHMLDREYRVTYRDTLIDTETIIRGKWIGKVKPGQDTVPVSIEEDVFEDLNLELGDPITFNVQGALINAKVASVRKIEWRKVQTNFLVLFPSGVLEEAPKTHVIVSKMDSTHLKENTRYQLVQRFPNVSVIDLDRILETLNRVLDKISFAIRFMGSFSMITGFIILIGSLVLTKYQRIRESVLLRTLGAVRKQVLAIQAVEYFMLGSIAALSGVIFGLIVSWATALFQFGTPFQPDLVQIIKIWGTVVAITLLIGLLNSRSVLKHPPLTILRRV